MKTIKDYQELRKQLETIEQNHYEEFDKNANGYLDATFIKVKMYGNNWHFKKKIGCEKDYNGWIFFLTSANSNGYELYEKIDNACKDFELLQTIERQL